MGGAMGDVSPLIAVQCGLATNTDKANNPTFRFAADDGGAIGELLWVLFKLDDTAAAPAFKVEYYTERADRGFGRVIEFKGGCPISSAESRFGSGEDRPPLVGLTRKDKTPAKKELPDIYIGSGVSGSRQVSRENQLSLSSVRRVLFFNRTFDRFPVLAIDPIKSGSDDPVGDQWTGVQLLNGGKDPLIRFRLMLRCAISSHNPAGKLPHDPERITITGVIALSGQLKGDETPRVKWGAFKVPERQGLAGVLKSFRVADDQATWAKADFKLKYGDTLEDVVDAKESWRNVPWAERNYPHGVDLRYHALPPPLHAVLPRLDPERLNTTDKSLWPTQWDSQAMLSIVRGPKFSQRVDLAGDPSAQEVQSYEIQFAVRAHREWPATKTPAEQADAKSQTQRGKQPNFPLVVDFRVEDKASAANRYFVIQRQPPFWCCTPQKDVTAAKRDLAVPWLVAIEDVDATLVADIWNTAADRYLEAVREIRNDRKISLFPRLTVRGDRKVMVGGKEETETGDENRRAFTLIFRLLDAPDRKSNPNEGSELQPTLWRLEPGRLQGLWGDTADAPDVSAERLFAGHAELPLFKGVGGIPFTFPFELWARPKHPFNPETATDNWRIDLPRQIAGLDPYRKAGQRDPETGQPEPARLVEFVDVELRQVEDNQGGDSSADFALGAYSLKLKSKPDSALGSRDSAPFFQVWFDTDWKASKASQLRGDTSDLTQRHAAYVNIRYRLSLADFYPSGQDKLPDEPDNSVRPVMIRLPTDVAAGETAGPPVEPGSPSLSLTVEESSDQDHRSGGVDQRQKVLLTVSSQARSTPPTDVLVIDTEPFFVAKVQVPALTPSDENTAIAVWDSDGPEGPYWRVTADRTGYSLLLPPQAIGETAIKTEKYALSPALPGRPDPQRMDDPKDGLNTALADFRFSPNARLKVFTSWREGKSGIVEPPFNTRHEFHWGYPHAVWFEDL
jgi:hypothetical protein